MKMSKKEEAAVALMGDIKKACIKRGLNLTIHDGKIGFVDQKEKKIVMLWSPEYQLK